MPNSVKTSFVAVTILRPLTISPVSSRVSRSAPSVISSPFSRWPPGKAHCPSPSARSARTVRLLYSGMITGCPDVSPTSASPAVAQMDVSGMYESDGQRTCTVTRLTPSKDNALIWSLDHSSNTDTWWVDFGWCGHDWAADLTCLGLGAEV